MSSFYVALLTKILRFQRFGKLLLPHLQRIWQWVQGARPLSLPALICLVEASLAAYPFDRGAVISVLCKLQHPNLPTYLRMMIANRQSISLRLKGKHDRSEAVIREILDCIAIDLIDLRSHCSYGRLLLSQTENAILREDFEKAMEHLRTWEVKGPQPSGLELKMLRLKNTVVGRVLRYQGEFSGARDSLQECLRMVPSYSSRYHIIHHLADVYCELGTPWKVEELVLNDVKDLRAHSKQHSKAYRRLVLPLAEAYIKQERFEAAEEALQELLDSKF